MSIVRLSRRTFLKFSTAATAFATPAALRGLTRQLFASLGQKAGSEQKIDSTDRNPDLHLDRYIDALPVLPVLHPSTRQHNLTHYDVHLLEFKCRLHSQLPPTTLWGYEGRYPGPTIEAWENEAVSIDWENRLPQEHLFTIDPQVHGAMPPAPAVRIVTHLHGAQTKSEDDGLPERWIPCGKSARYSYPNHQRAAALWYHDHALGITRLNLYAGLSGFYILRDQQEKELDLPAGPYEICLMVQDRTLDDHGQLQYTPTNEDGTPLPKGVWGPEFFGDLPVINGAIFPYCDVEPRLYRLRLLNASNSRFFNFFFNLAKTAHDIPALISFQQIGSDGGLLPRSVPLEKLLLAPAERADLLIDFSGLSGKTLTLMNDARCPFPGWQIASQTHAALNELMQFRVRLPLSPTKKFSIPGTMAFTDLPRLADVRIRNLVLTETVDKAGRSLGVRINGKGYDDPATETVKLGSMEKWRFINTTDDSHPMHLHLVQFRILERQNYDPVAWRANQLKLVGNPRQAPPNEAGWKDTAVVGPGEALTILVQFNGYTGRYLYHCHMAEHEDNDMMRPYEVVDSR